jgi:hypothetical protein
MTAANYNIVADQGATFTFAFTIDNDGTPWNLTGYKARMQVRPFVESTTKIFDLNETDGIALGGVLGTVTVTRSAAQMAAARAGRHVYDLELESGDGTVTKVLSGRFVIGAEVTR